MSLDDLIPWWSGLKRTCGSAVAGLLHARLPLSDYLHTIERFWGEYTKIVSQRKKLPLAQVEEGFGWRIEVCAEAFVDHGTPCPDSPKKCGPNGLCGLRVISPVNGVMPQTYRQMFCDASGRMLLLHRCSAQANCWCLTVWVVCFVLFYTKCLTLEGTWVSALFKFIFRLDSCWYSPTHGVLVSYSENASVKERQPSRVCQLSWGRGNGAWV